MKFIKLTKWHTDATVFVDPEFIQMIEAGSNSTCVSILTQDDIYVKQTPDEIFKLIEE